MWFEIEYYPYKKDEFPSEEALRKEYSVWGFAEEMCRVIWSTETEETITIKNCYGENSKKYYESEDKIMDERAKEILIEAIRKIKELK